MKQKPSGRSGIILLLVSGLLVMLLLMGVFLLRGVGFASAGARARSAAALARLSALSGMEYAAARLAGEAAPPGSMTLENRGDDWTFRDGLSGPFPAAANPSYSHGEHWGDPENADSLDNDGDGSTDEGDEGNGAYDAGLDDVSAASWTDRDGNGRFSAWSGRLRGGQGHVSNTFSLKITSSSGLANVNSGELGSPTGDHDLDGRLNRDDGPGSYNDTPPRVNLVTYDVDLDANGVSDWRDPDLPGNRHLVNFLNNLGAVLGLPTTNALYAPAQPPAAPINRVPVVASDLGTRVVANRPRGGYTSINQLETILVGGGFYTKAEFDLVSPFLSTDGEIVPVAIPSDVDDDPADPCDLPVAPAGYGHNFCAHLRQLDRPEGRYEFHSRIGFNEAPVEILKAALRYLSASGACHPYDLAFPGSIQTTENEFVRLVYNPFSGVHEGDRIAEGLFAQRPIHTLKQLLMALDSDALAGAYLDDLFTTGVSDDETTLSRKRTKEDMIVAQLDANGYFYDIYSRAFVSLDVPRTDGASRTRFIRRVPKSALFGPLSSAPYNATGGRSQQLSDYIQGLPGRMTVEFSLASLPSSSCSFRVASHGTLVSGGVLDAQALISGELAGGGSLLLTSQQDFEMFSASWPPSLGATDVWPVDADDPWRLPGGQAYAEGSAPASAPARDGVQSYPKFQFRSQVTGGDSYGPGSFSTPPPTGADPVTQSFRYPRALGDLRLSVHQLADAELTADTCTYALPFNEDRPTFPTSKYDPKMWEDNMADPAYPPRFEVPQFTDGNPSSPSPDLHVVYGGLLCSPAGPRWIPHRQWDDYPSLGPLPAQYTYAWGTTAPFPLPRSDYPGAPPGSGMGSILRGTIEFWLSDRGIENAFHDYYGGRGISTTQSYSSFVLTYSQSNADIGLLRFLNVSNRISIFGWKEDGSVIEEAPAVSGVVGTGWHHVAMVFSDSGDFTDHAINVSLWLEGEKVGATNLYYKKSAWESGPAPDGGMSLRLYEGGLDDFRFFSDTGLLPVQIEDRIRANARAPRYGKPGALPTQAWGDYTSPRLALDPSLLPQGARIRGISWDGFIPESTGGRFTFDLVGYGAGGAPLNPGANDPGRSVQWDMRDHWDPVSETSALQAKPFRLDRCRRFEVKVRIDAEDDDTVGSPPRWADAWPRIGPPGDLQPALRDTPILNEIRVHYAPAGAVWKAWSTR